MLGDARRDVWITFEELQIAFFGGLGDGAIESLLQDAEGALDEEPKHPFERGDLLEEPVLAGIVDGEQFAFFEGFDKQIRRLAFGEAGDITGPPVLYGEEEDGLDAFLVQIVGADTAFNDEGFEIADLAFLKEKGLFADFPMLQQGVEEGELFFPEVDISGDEPVYLIVHAVVFDENSQKKEAVLFAEHSSCSNAYPFNFL